MLPPRGVAWVMQKHYETQKKIAIPLKPMYAGNVFTHSTLALIYLCIIRRSLLLVVSKRMRLGNM